MHVIFIPYGKRSEVEVLLREMEAQKFKWVIWKGKKKKNWWLNGAIRLLPFGIHEYVFPREGLDEVLTTLGFKHIEDTKRYHLGKFKLGVLRKAINAEPVPEFDESKQFLWIKDHVNIIPLGIRYDDDYTETSGEFKGWTHEAI